MFYQKKFCLGEEVSNILVAPLNWGLGHATRCVPLIHKLQERNFNVILAADGRAWDFFREEFPDMMLIRLPSQKITYPVKGSFMLKMLGALPALYRNIAKEHRFLKRIIKEHNIRAVISDNRYGLWSEDTPSVFIGHQMMVKFPRFLKWFEWPAHKISLKLISRFNECWIPDYQGKINLSGDLSHKYPLPDKYHYIGPLSRFHFCDEDERAGFDADRRGYLLVILSGPEPQRSILERKIFMQLKRTDYRAVVVRGVTEKQGEYQLTENIRVLHHANTDMMKELFMNAEIVICRPGYSSIMDLTAAGKKAVFIPTPGQTEQQYLAQYFYTNKIFYYSSQRSFHLETALERAPDYKGVQVRYNPALLEERIDRLAKMIRDQ